MLNESFHKRSLTFQLIPNLSYTAERTACTAVKGEKSSHDIDLDRTIIPSVKPVQAIFIYYKKIYFSIDNFYGTILTVTNVSNL